jgi:hypothetical protein
MIIRLQVATFLVAIVAMVPLSHRAARTYQRQIDALDRLREE